MQNKIFPLWFWGEIWPKWQFFWGEEIHPFPGLRRENEEFTCFLGRALYAGSCCRPWWPRTARYTRLFTQQTVEEVGQHSLICCCCCSYKHTNKKNDLRWQWGYPTNINLPCVVFQSKHTPRFTITNTIILKELSMAISWKLVKTEILKHDAGQQNQSYTSSEFIHQAE